MREAATRGAAGRRTASPFQRRAGMASARSQLSHAIASMSASVSEGVPAAREGRRSVGLKLGHVQGQVGDVHVLPLVQEHVPRHRLLQYLFIYLFILVFFCSC